MRQMPSQKHARHHEANQLLPTFLNLQNVNPLNVPADGYYFEYKSISSNAPT
jgi:hypothetical protein